MNGGAAQVGSVGATVAEPLLDELARLQKVVPRSKMSVIEDSWGPSSSG